MSRVGPRPHIQNAAWRCIARHGGMSTCTRQSSNSTYHDALTLLNSTQSGYTALDKRRQQGFKLDSDSLRQMRRWLRLIGYSSRDLNRMNIIHVAGTKGKGSTCAMTNAILQRFQETTQLPRKIGLYTSPHLVTVRERITINSQPISESLFAKYFFDVWNALDISAAREGLDTAADKPSYFRLLTLMSFHAFMQENVDVAIYEVGVGGEFDSTNVIDKPLATAITTLGIDHVLTLGDSIQLITWHKAGIMKTGCPALTTAQVPEAMKVLKERAEEKGVKLTEVTTTNPALRNVALLPPEDYQKKNASLAVELAYRVLARIKAPVEHREDRLPSQFVEGLENLKWRGRCEILATGKQNWHLDGAHNEQSLEIACRWFGRSTQEKSVLQNRAGRASYMTADELEGNVPAPCCSISSPPETHMLCSRSSTGRFTARAAQDLAMLSFVLTLPTETGPGMRVSWHPPHRIVCSSPVQLGRLTRDFLDQTNLNLDPAELKSLALQHELAETWRRLDQAAAEITVLPSIEDAIGFIRGINSGGTTMDVLVTGSFHLVGGVLKFLECERLALANTLPSGSPDSQ